MSVHLPVTVAMMHVGLSRTESDNFFVQLCDRSALLLRQGAAQDSNLDEIKVLALVSTLNAGQLVKAQELVRQPFNRALVIDLGRAFACS